MTYPELFDSHNDNVTYNKTVKRNQSAMSVNEQTEGEQPINQ